MLGKGIGMERPSWNKLVFSCLPAALLLLAGMAALDLYREPFRASLQAGEDPLVIQGRRLYTQLRCQYCHRIKGRGGKVGPALDNVGFTRTRQWLADHFRDPGKFSKGSKMAQIPLKDDEVKALTAYMNSLGGRTFSPEARVLYLAYCANCHRMNDSGGFKGPDLTYEGEFRDVDFIANRIRDPLLMKPDSTMPSFGRTLTEAQIKDLAVYVFRSGN